MVVAPRAGKKGMGSRPWRFPGDGEVPNPESFAPPSAIATAATSPMPSGASASTGCYSPRGECSLRGAALGAALFESHLD